MSAEPTGFKGTGGEWTVTPGDSRLEIWADADLVAIVGDEPYWERFTAMDEANATLFAASKDLLAALQGLAEAAERELPDQPCNAILSALETARAAIARAVEVGK